MLPTTLYDRLKQSELAPIAKLNEIFDQARVKFQKFERQLNDASTAPSSLLNDGADSPEFDSTDFALNLPGSSTQKAPPRLDRFEEFFLDELVRQEAINNWQAEQLRRGHVRFYLGDYRVVDLLGRGGYGNVFLGRLRANDSNRDRTCSRFSTDVALKVLQPDATTRSARLKFLHEIQISKQLCHPNIVRFINASTDGAVRYAVYEYVDGGDARRLLGRFDRLPFRVASYIVSETAKALDYLHSLGVVHRDVKPGNILLMKNGKVQLADFGFVSPTIPFSSTARLSPLGVLLENWEKERAKATREENSKRKIKGTPDYLAPDQILNPDAPSPLWDVYSLGSAFYFMLTGVVPYPSDDSRDKLNAHLRSSVPPEPATFDPNIPPEVSQLTMRMLERDPARRVASAREAIDALSRWAPSYSELTQVNFMSSLTKRDAAPDFWTEENLRDVFSRVVVSHSPVVVPFFGDGETSNAKSAGGVDRSEDVRENFSFFGSSKKSRRSPEEKSKKSPKSQLQKARPAWEEPVVPMTFEDFEKSTAASAANFEAAFEFVEQAFQSSAQAADASPSASASKRQTRADATTFSVSDAPIPPDLPSGSSPPPSRAVPARSTFKPPLPPELDASLSRPSPPPAPAFDHSDSTPEFDAQTRRLERLNAVLLRRVLLPLLIATALALAFALIDALFF